MKAGVVSRHVVFPAQCGWRSRTKKTKLKCQLREINSFPWDSIQLSVFYLKYNFYK